MSPPQVAAPTFPVAELERRFYAFAIDRVLGWLPAVVAGVGAWFLLDDGWLAVGLDELQIADEALTLHCRELTGAALDEAGGAGVAGQEVRIAVYA